MRIDVIREEHILNTSPGNIDRIAVDSLARIDQPWRRIGGIVDNRLSRDIKAVDTLILRCELFETSSVARDDAELVIALKISCAKVKSRTVLGPTEVLDDRRVGIGLDG